MNIRIEIQLEVRQCFPGIHICCFAVDNLAKCLIPPEEISIIFNQAYHYLSSEVLTVEQLLMKSRISSWRAAARTSGLKPSEFRSSVEQLARRMLKGAKISSQLALVELYCAFSAKYLLPLGGYDLERLEGQEIQLRMMNPKLDRFSPIGADADTMPQKASVVVYASKNEVLCWNFNHRDSISTCLTSMTNRAIFIGEILDAKHAKLLTNMMEDMRQILIKYGAEATQIMIVNEKQMAAEMEVRDS